MLKRVPLLLPLMVLLAVIGLAVGQAYDPPPADANHALPASDLRVSNLEVQDTLIKQRSVTLTWNWVNNTDDDIARYEVERRPHNPDQEAGDNWQPVPHGNDSQSSVITGLQPATRYDFRVRAFTDTGHRSFFTNTEGHQTANGPRQASNPRVWMELGSPGSFPDTAPTYSMTVAWDAPSERRDVNNNVIPPTVTVGGYYVSHQANAGVVAPDPAVKLGQFGRRYTFPDLTLNTSYAFYVYTCEDGNDPDTCGRPVAVGAETPRFGPPHEVDGPIEVTGTRELHRHLAGRAGPGRVLHRINYSVGGVQSNHPSFGYAQRFEIEWNDRNSPRNWRALGSGAMTSVGVDPFTDQPIIEHRDFATSTDFGDPDSIWVRIRGANQTGGGPWTNPIQVHFTPYIQNAGASVDGDTATMTWSTRGTAAKYQVHKVEYAPNRDTYGRDHNPRPWGQPWEDVDAGATSHEFTGLEIGKTYILRVRACDANGRCSFAVTAYAVTGGAEQAPGPLVDPRIYINTCTKRFWWDITPPAETASHGKAERYQFQYKRDDDEDGTTYQWTDLLTIATPKWQQSVSDAFFKWRTVESGSGPVREQVEDTGWNFHIRVRAVNEFSDLNDFDAGPWSTTTGANRPTATEANRDGFCDRNGPMVAISTPTTAQQQAPPDTSETVDPPGGETSESNTEQGNGNTGNGNTGTSSGGQNSGGQNNGGNTNTEPVNTETEQEGQPAETENSDAQTGDTGQPAQTENSDIQTEQGGEPEQTENTDAQTEQPGQPQAQESNSQPDSTGDTGNTGDTVTTALEEQPEEDAQTRRVVRRYDVNHNGNVDLEEVLTAIGDYFLTDSLALEDLLALLRQYRAA